MKWVLLHTAVLMLLAACGGEAPEPATDNRSDSSEASNESAPDAVPISGPPVRILAFGNSLFAGYNLGGEEGFPEVLEAQLRRRGINAEVIDAGVSGDTTAAGRQRLDFVLDNAGEPVDLAIVELGGNDILRGLPPAETRANLSAIMEELDTRGIDVLLMGMRAPPNLGADFVNAFDVIYPQLAERYGAELVPFFLEPIYRRPELIQSDRIHPTAEGVEVLVATTIEEVIDALPQAEGDGD